MSTTPTLAEFLAMPSDPDEEALDTAPTDQFSANTYQEGFADGTTHGRAVAMAEAMPGSRGLLESFTPLEQIAASLHTIAEAAHVSAYLDKQATELAERLTEAECALADAHATMNVQADLIARVLEVVKPSTSKLANNVRAVLEGAAESVTGADEEPAAPTPAEISAAFIPVNEHNNDQDAPPAADAKVEEWRAYARSRGYNGPDVDKANRSQIRTMLGISHPGSS